MKIYFDDVNMQKVNINEDLIVKPYKLDLNHNFQLNFLGSYPIEKAINFTYPGFYYSDYGIRDNFEIYYIEISPNGNELYFYDVYEIKEDDE